MQPIVLYVQRTRASLVSERPSISNFRGTRSFNVTTLGREFINWVSAERLLKETKNFHLESFIGPHKLVETAGIFFKGTGLYAG